MKRGSGIGKAIAAAALAAALAGPGAALAWQANTFALTDGDFARDAKEAKEGGKKIAIIVHMDDCPSCEALEAHLESSPALIKGLAKGHVLMGVNIRGAVELTAPDGKKMTEGEYARSLGVFATPTVVLLGADGKPEASALGYAASKSLLEALAGSGNPKREAKSDARKKRS